MSDAELLRVDVRAQPAVAPENSLSTQRRTALAAMALVLLGFALYWPTTASLALRWQDLVHRTYTHGYLIVALTLWLLWRGRSRWVDVPARAFVPGAAALLAGAFAWLIAFRAGLQIVHQALLPLLIFAAVLTGCGPAVARRMWLPLAYLYFAVPVWDALNPLLQGISVSAVRTLLRVAGVPTFFVGNSFQIPAGSFEIADGCSGLHFLVVALPIAVLYGEINRDSWRTRTPMILLAGALAMAANWLRIFIIVMAGHLSDMQHRLITGEHYTFGWFVFAGTMILFFLIARRWPAGEVTGNDASAAAVPDGLRAGSGAPVSFARGFSLAVGALSIVPAWNLLDRNLAAPERLAQFSPRPIAGWSGPQPVSAAWRPTFKGVDREELHQFESGGSVVQRYTAVYARQRQGKELVSYDNSVLGPGLRAASTATAAGDAWMEMLVQDSQGEQWLLRYAYQIDAEAYLQPMRAQFAYAFASLFGAPASAIVILRSACAADCDAVRSALDRFSADARR